MTVKRFNHVALIHQIMEQGDPEGATRTIMNWDTNLRAKNLSACFYNIRTKIIRNPKYHLPGAMDELLALSENHDYPASDRIRLKKIIQDAPMHRIQWFQNSKRIFSNEDIEAKFKAVRLFRDPFYDFNCPSELFEKTYSDIQEDLQDRHMHIHKKKSASEFEFTEEQIDAMVETARDYIFAPVDWKLRPNALRLMECMCLLTGRRKWEVCNTLQIRTVPGFPYLAEVKGIAKSKKANLQEDTWAVIPLLAPVEEIIQGITQVRQFVHPFGHYVVHASLFPDNMNHTAFRDIYSSTTYRFRHINRFQDSSTSEVGWKKSALLVTMNTVFHYSTMSYHRNDVHQSPQQPQQPVPDPAMAHSFCGPQDNSS